MRPSASSSQCSSITSPNPAVPGLVWRSPAGMNFSPRFSVSMGNEILTGSVLVIDIASIAFGELPPGSPSFLLRTLRHRGRKTGQAPSLQGLLKRCSDLCSRARRFLPLLAQQLLQHSDAFIHVLFFQQERRQEAQDRVLGRVEQYALRQSLLHQWPCGNVEHEALNESAAARFAGSGILVDQFLELLMQVPANLHDVFEQMLFFDDRQIFEPDTARQRTAAKGSAVLSGRNSGGEVFLGQECAERHSRGDRLGDGDDIGHNAEALEGEDVAGTAKAALDFVEDKSSLVLVGKRTARAQEIFGTLEDAAFAKDGLQHDGAGVGIDRRVQRFDVVLRHKGHVFEQRLKALAVLFLAGQRQGAKRSAVKRTLQRHQLGLGLAARLVSGETRQLDGAFHCFGSAVRKEDPVKARKPAKAFGELSLVFVVIEIRNVNDPSRLLADGLHDARMSVPEGVHPQPGHEVEILFALEVVEENTFAALKAYGIAVVGGEKKTLFKIGNL